MGFVSGGVDRTVKLDKSDLSFIFSLKSVEHLIFGCLQFSDRSGKVVVRIRTI